MTLVIDSLRAALPPAAAAATAFVRKTLHAVGTVLKALSARRQLAQIAHLSDHMLRDIGLERGDLRDATALPFGADPTRFLVIRAVERRAARAVRQRAAATHREVA